jgi:hypothetical protein
MIFSIHHSPDGFGANAVQFEPPALTFSIDALHVRYVAKQTTDGTTLAGTWTDEKPVPLDFHRATNQNAWRDTTQDKISFIPVQENVRLEAIDWGGTGRPLALPPGLRNTAHIFDKFAPKLTPNYHV